MSVVRKQGGGPGRSTNMGSESESESQLQQELSNTKQDLRVLKTFAKKSQVQIKNLQKIIYIVFQTSFPEKWKIAKDGVSEEVVADFEITYPSFINELSSKASQYESKVAEVSNLEVELNSQLEKCGVLEKLLEKQGEENVEMRNILETKGIDMNNLFSVTSCLNPSDLNKKDCDDDGDDHFDVLPFISPLRRDDSRERERSPSADTLLPSSSSECFSCSQHLNHILSLETNIDDIKCQKSNLVREYEAALKDVLTLQNAVKERDALLKSKEDEIDKLQKKTSVHTESITTKSMELEAALSSLRLSNEASVKSEMELRASALSIKDEEINKLNERIVELEKERSDDAAELERTKEQAVSEFEASISPIKAQLDEKDSALRELEETVRRYEELIKNNDMSHRDRIVTLEETHGALLRDKQERIEGLQATVAQQETRSSELEEGKTEVQTRLEEREVALSKSDEKNDNNKKRIEELETSLELIQQELKGREAIITTIKNENMELEAALSSLRLSNEASVKSEMELRASALSIKDEEINKLNERIVELEKERSDDAAELERTKEQAVSEFEASISPIKAQLDEKDSALRELEETVRRYEELIKNNDMSHRDRIVTLEETHGALLRDKQERIEELQATVAQQETRSSELEEAKAEVQTRLEEREVALSKSDEKNDNNKKRIEELETNLELIQQELKGREAIITAIKNENMELEAALSSLRLSNEASVKSEMELRASALSIKDEEINKLKERIVELEKERSDDAAELERTKEQAVSEFEASISPMKTQLDEKDSALRELEETVRRYEELIKNNDMSHRDRIVTLEETHGALLRDKQERIEELQATVAQQETRSSELEEGKAEVQTRLEEREVALSKSDEKNDNNKKRIEELETSLELIQQELKGREAIITTIKNENMELEAALSSLRLSNEASVKSEMEVRASALSIKDEEINKLNERIVELEKERSDDAAELERTKEQAVSEFEASISPIKAQLDEKDSALRELEETVRRYEELIKNNDMSHRDRIVTLEETHGALLRDKQERIEGLQATVAQQETRSSELEEGKTEVQTRLEEREVALSKSDEKNDNNKKRIEELETSLELIQQELKGREAIITTIKNENMELEAALSSLRLSNEASVKSEMELRASALSIKDEEINKLNERIVELEKERSDDAAELERTKEQAVSEFEASISPIKAQLDEKDSALRELEETVRRYEELIKNNDMSHRDRIVTLEETHGALLRDKQERIEELQATVAQQETRSSELEEAKAEVQTRLEEREVALSKSDEKNDNNKKRIEELETSLELIQQELKGREAIITTIKNENMELEAALSSLRLSNEASVKSEMELRASALSIKDEEINKLNERIVELEKERSDDAAELERTKEQAVSEFEASISPMKTQLDEKDSAVVEELVHDSLLKLENYISKLEFAVAEVKGKFAELTFVIETEIEETFCKDKCIQNLERIVSSLKEIVGDISASPTVKHFDKDVAYPLLQLKMKQEEIQKLKSVVQELMKHKAQVVDKQKEIDTSNTSLMTLEKNYQILCEESLISTNDLNEKIDLLQSEISIGDADNKDKQSENISLNHKLSVMNERFLFIKDEHGDGIERLKETLTDKQNAINRRHNDIAALKHEELAASDSAMMNSLKHQECSDELCLKRDLLHSLDVEVFKGNKVRNWTPCEGCGDYLTYIKELEGIVGKYKKTVEVLTDENISCKKTITELESKLDYVNSSLSEDMIGLISLESPVKGASEISKSIISLMRTHLKFSCRT